MTDIAPILRSTDRLVLADADAPALAADLAAAQAGEVFVLDGAQARDKASFMAAAARALQFPDYFGGNWDAFADCFDELHWRDVPIYVVVADADQLLAAEPAELDPLLHILRDSFAANPELPQSRLVVILAGTPAAPVIQHAQQLGLAVARA